MLSLAFCKADFSSGVSSYSEDISLTGLEKTLKWSREYILDIITPSPSLFTRAVAKLWLLPEPSPLKGLNLTVWFPDIVQPGDPKNP